MPPIQRVHAVLAVGCLAIALLHAPAAAQTITVDIADADVIDVDPDTATVADLPGPDGHISFSEAMIASNNTPGRQTVGFAIPVSEWTYLPLIYTGRAVITGMMFYANAFDEVTIDGTTQTAFTGNTNPNGGEVVILRGGGLYLPADGCTLRGLDLTNVYIDGSGSTVENCSTMGIDIYGGSGGGSGNIVRNNTGGGYVKIDQANNNTVIGNTLNRVRVLGWVAGGRPATNNRIGGQSLAERNYITGTGTRNSQGIPGGMAVELFDSTGTLIENNWIGTTPDGLSQGNPYTTIGISFDSENHNTDIRNNLIAGILAVALPPHAPAYYVGTGISVYGSGSGISITGNTLGLNANGEALLGSVTGISTTHFCYPTGVQGVTIGGTAPGQANHIAGHRTTGVTIANTYSGVRVSGNSIHDNGGMSIDLIPPGFEPGITPNDPLDTDTGGNALQNFPVIASASAVGATYTRIQGTLSTHPNESFMLEFFASPDCGTSGQGESARFLGSIAVTTDSSGSASFAADLASPASAGEYATATATRLATNDTSELSLCVPISSVPAPCIGDFDASGAVNTADLTVMLGTFGQAVPPGSGADINADGHVNTPDLTAMLGVFGTSCQ